MEQLKDLPIEKSIVQCKHCGETKERVMDGRFPTKKEIRWVDPITGKLWSGNCCDVCHREKCAQRKRNKSRIKA